MKDKRTYASWSAMKQRCNNVNYHGYYKHGGRGIKICKRWAIFENFLKDMGIRPEGKTLDRINNDGDYKPSNCKWSTPLEQAHNQRPKHNLIPKATCVICNKIYSRRSRQHTGKYCSRSCYFKSMIGHKRNGVSKLRVVKRRYYARTKGEAA